MTERWLAMPLEEKSDYQEKADSLAREILSFSRNNLFLNLRFMENALSRLVLKEHQIPVGTDGRYLYFNSEYILHKFHENSNSITRIYLHTVLHCIFQHFYVNPTVNVDLWDLACDIAVEQMLRELNLTCVDTSCENGQDAMLEYLSSNLKYMTAEKIYYFLSGQNLSDERILAMRMAFIQDDHRLWYDYAGRYGNNDGFGGNGNGHNEPDYGDGSMSYEEAIDTWKKISEQIQVDLETFSKLRGSQAGHFMQNLQALHREKYDYTEFLRKFAVYGEVMKIDEDTFDYNFYTYGMNLYGNMPLIEPLEYKDAKRVRDFVVAIDTSGSVSGEIVQNFVQKTYNILKQQESFFSKVNIHIIQCDAEIQEDAKITSQEEFDEYLKHMQLHGFGGTDFRPVFSYVEELIKNKEFTDLRGLLYFTDGYGVFPEHQPPYQTAFVFLDDNYNNYDVPVWAMRIILETNDLEKNN